MAEFEEAQLEKNLREFVLGRTAEAVYMELREGLIIIRHMSRYGSSILATFWSRVLQHPNNYPPLRYPYKKLYDTKGLWKIVVQVEDVVITIFTKTGTMTIKGALVLEWFVNRFQAIMDGFEAPVQETHQSIPRSPRRRKQQEDTTVKSSDITRSLDSYLEDLEGFSSRFGRRNKTTEPLSLTENNDGTLTDRERAECSAENKTPDPATEEPIESVESHNGSKEQQTEDIPMGQEDAVALLDRIDDSNFAQATPQVGDIVVPVTNPVDTEFVSDLVDLGNQQATGETDFFGTAPERKHTPEQTNEQAHDVSGLLDRAKEVIFDLIDQQEAVSVNTREAVSEEVPVDVGQQYRQDLQMLNDTLKTQDLDLWVGEVLEKELEELSAGCVREGSSYVYKLWKSLLHKFLSLEDCNLYIASPNMDKLRLQDICHALLRNRLTACVDAVFVRRHCDSAQLISDVKRSAIREYTTRDQVFIEYKLYSSFVYPFQEFHYRFLAGVKNGQAEIMITSADFHGNHFENDSLDVVSYHKMSEDEFRVRYLSPLLR